MVWMVACESIDSCIAAGESGGGRIQTRAIFVRLQHTQLRQRSKNAVDDLRQLFLAPAQEKLGGDVRIDAPRQALDVVGTQHGVADERTGDQRRQREQVQDVVAVVGDELRALVAHLHDVAELVRHARNDLERLAVEHDLGRGWRRSP